MADIHRLHGHARNVVVNDHQSRNRFPDVLGRIQLQKFASLGKKLLKVHGHIPGTIGRRALSHIRHHLFFLKIFCTITQNNGILQALCIFCQSDTALLIIHRRIF